ncbi:MAG: hypothetical protein AAGN46_13025, partial [Acidobacteriota bacterium]
MTHPSSAALSGDAVLSPIAWDSERSLLRLLDQTLLPGEETWLDCPDPETVAAAIRRLSVRGAPAIGVAAAYGLAHGLQAAPGDEGDAALRRRFEAVRAML